MKRIFLLAPRMGLLVGMMVGMTALALLGSSCKGGGVADDPVLRLSAEESLAQGKQLLAKEKWDKARPYFTHAFEVEPNSTIGRESLLLAADTYYLSGGTTNFVQAEAKYRDFLNRFPTSDQSSYVQFQIANSLAKRMEKPDRDQNVTRKALEAYEELVRLYPTSEYAAQSQEQMNAVLSNLAEHEFQIGRFYLRYGVPIAAAERFQFLLDTYPEYKQRDKVIYHLGMAYIGSFKPEEAYQTFDRLIKEYPESPFIQEIPTQKDKPTPTQKAGK